jgi:long-chain acyl-CoA synthetase
VSETRGSFFLELRAVALRSEERAALSWEGGGLSYRQLFSRADGFADRLRSAGLQQGDRLAIALPNGPEFVVATLAGLELGATVAPLDPLLKAGERATVVEQLQPALVVDAAGIRPGRRGAAAGAAIVLYTSGSTGRPKGALLSDQALLFANRSWAGPVMGLVPDDAVLGVLPFAHSFGLNAALFAPLLTGASVVLRERFVPESVAELIAARALDVLPGVATMFRRLLDLPAFAGGGRLRLAVSGAAPCPWPLAREWRARTGVRIVRGYGMTELFRPISYRADDDADLENAIGRPLPGVDVRIAGEAGEPLPAGQVGELWVRSPAAMDGYLDAIEETDAALVDGWFRTGDLASLSAAGFVAIAGRKDGRILRGGYSVFPADVEAVLAGHPAVLEAAVLGVPDAELGEEVAAFVALREGARVEPAALVAYCRERLAAFKYPRRVAIVPALPRSATGKLLKSRLLEEGRDIESRQD